MRAWHSLVASCKLRLRLHGRGFQWERFHDLETASKTTRFRRVYTEPIQPCDLVLRPLRFVIGSGKIPESCKSEVKPQIKVVIVQQSAALRARLTIFTSRDSQFRARPFSNRCGFAVYTTSKPYRFENAPLLKAYSKRPGFDNELGRLRVNERCNRIETDAVTNETASV